MTPHEILTRNIKAALETHGVNIPCESLLIEALEGKRVEAKSSGVILSAALTEQTYEPLPIFRFEVSAAIHCALDDDKTGTLFRDNFTAVFDAFHSLSLGDDCAALGNDDFRVDGFQFAGSDEPSFEEDEFGGSWTAVFRASVAGMMTAND